MHDPGGLRICAKCDYGAMVRSVKATNSKSNQALLPRRLLEALALTVQQSNSQSMPLGLSYRKQALNHPPHPSVNTVTFPGCQQGRGIGPYSPPPPPNPHLWHTRFVFMFLAKLSVYRKGVFFNVDLLKGSIGGSSEAQHPLAGQIRQVVLVDIQHPQSSGGCQTYWQGSCSASSLFGSSQT